MRVAIIGNNDATSDIIFHDLLLSNEVDVVFVGHSTRMYGGLASSAKYTLKLLSKTTLSYLSFLVLFNIGLKIRDAVACRRKQGAAGASLARLARWRGIPYLPIPDCNSAEFLELLSQNRVDLMLVRIPQILKPDVFNAATYGAWCLHSSLLPSYGGYCAEFHAMRNGESHIGSTLFRIDESIDGGPPIAQCHLPVRTRESLLAHVLANNTLAGRMVRDAVEELARSGQVEPKLHQPRPQASYFRWPNAEQEREFRRRGFRLFGWRDTVRFLAWCVGLSSAPCARAR
ncbi:formyltransferase family protein [Azospirillum isscasi]|uniref:Formyltransferase family protein n=1 Tax=Azospirillum isscasi TaxID=3053926 RepID=A0ABU0WMD4_9PROT|nr:formyltransferase family protein [Azospirillum isscasi]MDQ2105341.1 formyltransferase family protein [Azospirillum isscasi]